MSLPLMKNYVNGEWVESNTTTFGDVWNQALGEKIAKHIRAGISLDHRPGLEFQSEHLVFQRIGNEDTNTVADWAAQTCTQANTAGVLNNKRRSQYCSFNSDPFPFLCQIRKLRILHGAYYLKHPQKEK